MIIVLKWTEKRSGSALVGRCTCVHQPNASGACHRSPGIRLHDAGWGPQSAAGRPSACQQPHEEGTLLQYALVQVFGVGTHLTTAFLAGTFHLGFTQRSWRLFLASALAAVLALPLLWPVLEGLWMTRDQLTQSVGTPQGGYGLLRFLAVKWRSGGC